VQSTRNKPEEGDFIIAASEKYHRTQRRELKDQEANQLHIKNKVAQPRLSNSAPFLEIALVPIQSIRKHPKTGSRLKTPVEQTQKLKRTTEYNWLIRVNTPLEGALKNPA